MWKKVMVFSIIIVALSALFIIGASAAITVDSPVFDVDYSTGKEVYNPGWHWGPTDASAVYTDAKWGLDYGIYSNSVNLNSLEEYYFNGYPVYQAFSKSFKASDTFTVEWYGQIGGDYQSILRLCTIKNTGANGAAEFSSNGAIEIEYWGGDICAWYTYTGGGNLAIHSSDATDATKKSYTFERNSFHHIVVTKGTTYMKLYVDGVLVAQSKKGDIFNEDTSFDYYLPAATNNNSATQGRFIRGRVWTGAASEDQVTSLYQSHLNKTVCDIDFTNLNYEDSTGTFTNTARGGSLADASTMNSKDAWRDAVYSNNTGFVYTAPAGRAAFPKNFTIEYYGVFTPNTEIMSIGNDSTGYNIETQSNKFNVWRSPDNAGSGAASTLTYDLNMAHYIVLVGNSNKLTVYVDGVKYSEPSIALSTMDMARITLRAQYLMSFKVKNYSVSATDIANAYKSMRGIRFHGANLTLKNNIDLGFMVPTNLYASNTGVTFKSISFTSGGQQCNYTKTTSGGFDIYTIADINPTQLDKQITATMTATDYLGNPLTVTKTYSVLDYCKNMIGSSKSTLGTLIVDLVNYGAAAQVYNGGAATFNDWLGNKASWATSDKTYVSHKTISELANATVKWRSVGLNLNDTADLRFKIATDSLTGLVARVTFNGKTEDYSNFSNASVAGEYYFYFDKINADQMSDTVTITILRNGTPVSDTITYSVESYAASTQYDTGNLGSVVRAMMRYGNAAKAYVG